MKIRYSIVALLLILLPRFFVPLTKAQSTSQLDQPITLSEKTTLTVSKEDVEAWRTKYPDHYDANLSIIKGTLVGYRLQLTDGIVMFAIDHRDAKKSDIAIRCGTRSVNPSRLVTDDQRTGSIKIGRPGAFTGDDGRDYSLTMGRQSLLFFFDLPSECRGQPIVLTVTLQVGDAKNKTKKTVDISVPEWEKP